MRPLLVALLLCAASLARPAVSALRAGPPEVTLLGNIAWLSPVEGWVEVSSSAGYGLVCYQAMPQPAACRQAITRIYATHDGGRTWRRLLHFSSQPVIGPTALPTVWMHVFDTQHGLVIAPAAQPRAELYRTTDGGATWTALPLPSRSLYSPINDVAFVGMHDLWVLAHLGGAMGAEAVRIYRTRDAGGHWAMIACVAFPNATPGYGCRLRSGLTLGGRKDSITFTSPSHGVLTVNNNSGIPALSVTHDGGLHWHTNMPGWPHGVPAPNATTGVFPDVELGQPLFFGKVGILPMTVRICRRAHVPTNYVCTSGLYTLLTHDGGQTWPLTRRFPFTADSLHRLAWQVMTPMAWRALVGTKLWFTDDAGAHWTGIPAAIPSGYTPVVVQFATWTTGWAIAAQIYQPDNVAQTTQLLRTDDGGRHWSSIPLPHV
jgi:photosystem II stability/assembly factor-like uncharacterized protein